MVERDLLDVFGGRQTGWPGWSIFRAMPCLNFRLKTVKPTLGQTIMWTIPYRRLTSWFVRQLTSLLKHICHFLIEWSFFHFKLNVLQNCCLLHKFICLVLDAAPEQQKCHEQSAMAQKDKGMERERHKLPQRTEGILWLQMFLFTQSERGKEEETERHKMWDRWGALRQLGRNHLAKKSGRNNQQQFPPAHPQF